MSCRICCLALLLAFSGVAGLSAQQKADSGQNGTGETEITQAEVLKFVSKHHPDLAMLLNRLKRQSPAEFEKAVRDTRETVTRVKRWNDRKNKSRANYEINRWKVDSRIRLLTAQMVSLMNDSSEGVEHPDLADAREELRDLSRQRVELDRERMKLEQKMLTDRLERLEEQLGRIEGDIEAAVDRQEAALTRAIDTAARKRGATLRKPRSKPSEKPGTDEKSSNKSSSAGVSKKK